LTADNAAAEAVAANLKELDELSTQLAAEFNPTPAADAAVEVTQQVEVIESIDPTDIIEGADPVGEPVATPLPVIEAAVDAVVAVDEAVVI
jgi:type VI protein secretion system component VasK